MDGWIHEWMDGVILFDYVFISSKTTIYEMVYIYHSHDSDYENDDDVDDDDDDDGGDNDDDDDDDVDDDYYYIR